MGNGRVFKGPATLLYTALMRREVCWR